MSGSPKISLVDLVTELPIARLKGGRPVVACDCYVKGIESAGKAVEWGWQLGHSENIDHHAPVARMAREVSSANLALTRLQTEGPVDFAAELVITHTDCDSVLTVGLLSGRLEPHERYGAASIAADHTGVENGIADLLQAIQDTRDVEHSLAMLGRLERGESLPISAREALALRQRKREEATRAVTEGRFSTLDGIWWAEFDHEIDGEFFPTLLPKAEVIVVACPHPTVSSRLAIKVRRGRSMSVGRTLHDLRLSEVDPAYGGRWNAGANKRPNEVLKLAGGTSLSTEEWVGRVSAQVAEALPAPGGDT